MITESDKYKKFAQLRRSEGGINQDEDILYGELAIELAPKMVDEIERLQEIESKAIEQSHEVQTEWLSPIEAEGLMSAIEDKKKHIAELEKENERLQKRIFKKEYENHPPNEAKYLEKRISSLESAIMTFYKDHPKLGTLAEAREFLQNLE